MRNYLATLSMLGTGALMAAASPCALAETVPYYPHAFQGSLEQVQSYRATFLLTEALHSIAMAHDSVSRAQQVKIRERLGVDSTLVELLHLDLKNPDHNDVVIQGVMGVWLQSYPSTSAESGAVAKMNWDSKELLSMAHSLIRLSYEVAGIARPRAVAEIVANTTFGPHTMYQSDRVRTMSDSLEHACGDKANALDGDSSAPKEYRWIRFALRHSPAFIKRYAEGYLGNGKTCQSLTRDVLDIVGPHSSPLRASVRKEGQLEGLSPYLTRSFFPAGEDPENTAMMRRMRKLMRVDRLDPQLPEEEAVAAALGGRVSGLALVRLMALASHNHGLELYLQKVALELVENRERAVGLALETLSALNHLYGLLQAHRLERKATAPDDTVARAERPYHYWGGAIVACEMRSRGYEPWVSALVSGMLGKVYESWTGFDGEGLSGKSEDISLHIEGAQAWAPVCQ